MTTITTVPSIYANGFFKRTGNGILPYTDCGEFSYQTLTWEDLNTILLTVRGDADFQAAYLVYLTAVIAGDSAAAADAVTAMNTIFAAYAAKLVSCSPFKTVRIYLFDNASNFTAWSLAPTKDTYEYGRTEIIVAQQNVDIIANNARKSTTTSQLTYYAGCAVGSYETNSEFPAHVLKLAVSYT